MPDVLTVEASEEDQDAVRDLFMRALNLALDGLIAMRAREGDSLRGDMMTKLDAIDASAQPNCHTCAACCGGIPHEAQSAAFCAARRRD